MIYEKTLRDFAEYAVSRNYRVITETKKPIVATRVSSREPKSTYEGHILSIGPSFDYFDKKPLPYSVNAFLEESKVSFEVEFPARKVKIHFVDEKYNTKNYFDFWIPPTISKFDVSKNDVVNSINFNELALSSLGECLIQQLKVDYKYILSGKPSLTSQEDTRLGTEFIFNSKSRLGSLRFELVPNSK